MWALAAAAVLAAVTVTGGALVMSGGRQQALAAQQAPAHTARVVKRTLSAMVSQAGTLTYRARSDGSRGLSTCSGPSSAATRSRSRAAATG